jgi:hypothetical protein
VHNWIVPAEWRNETAFIIGGGPSLEGFDAEVLRGRRVIAINNAYLLAPWADILFWGDLAWWNWNRNDLARFRGKYKVTRTWSNEYKSNGVKILEHIKRTPFSIDPTVVTGTDSGHSCINLAYHLGATTAVLLGFDMKRTGGKNNWHTLHHRETADGRYQNLFVPEMEKLAEFVGRLNDFEVVNCTPGSALSCFPIKDLEDVL